MLLSAVFHIARASTVGQITIFLPLTLVTLGRSAFLFLSLLLSVHALVHGALLQLWGSPALSFLQLPMHPFLLLLIFNAFPSKASPWLDFASLVWAQVLTYGGPLFIAMEGLSSLLVCPCLFLSVPFQTILAGPKARPGGQDSRRKRRALPVRPSHSICRDICHFCILDCGGEYLATLTVAFTSSQSYPDAASSPLSSTFLGVALTALVFLTFIGFVLRRTNIIESSSLAIFIAYNVWLCGFDPDSFSRYGSA